ncbi:MAG: hypothetical protein ACC652_01905 [Acidimicrobiales bacterium]
MRLGIDLDGVVADFTSGWVRRYNRDFDASVRVDQVTTWGAPKQITHFSTMGEFWRWVRFCGEGASLFRRLDLYPGALESLQELANDGHEIVIVTSKPQFAVADTYAWIAEHGLPAAEIHIVDDKSEVSCELYVDDGPYNLERLLVGRPDSVVVRFVRPWNAPIAGVLDAHSWSDVRRIVAEQSVLTARAEQPPQ